MPMDPGLEFSTRSVFILLGMTLAVLLAISASWALAIERWWSGKPLVPIRQTRPVPWGGRDVLLAFLVWQLATLAASVALRSSRVPGEELDLVAAIAAVSLVNLALMILLPALLVLLCGTNLGDLGLRRGTIGVDLAIGVVAALCAVPLVYAVQFAAILVWTPTAHPLQEMLIRQREPGVIALALVSAVVLAPVAEELLFRGILQGWLEKRARRDGEARIEAMSAAGQDVSQVGFDAVADAGSLVEPTAGSPWDAPAARSGPSGDWASGGSGRRGTWLALGFPAAFFAAVHAGQWPAPLPLFVLALGLGWLYRRTGGIVAPIAMHATFNGLSTAAMVVILLLSPAPAADPDALPDPEAIPVAPPVLPEAAVDPADAEASQARESAPAVGSDGPAIRRFVESG